MREEQVPPFALPTQINSAGPGDWKRDVLPQIHFSNLFGLLYLYFNKVNKRLFPKMTHYTFKSYNHIDIN